MVDMDYSQFEPAFKAETNVEENKVQETAPVTETPTEQTPVTETQSAEVVTTTETQATPQDTLNYEFFNKTFKTDFKTEDDIRKIIELSSKTKTLEDQLKDFETLKADVEEYKKGIDPLAYFASEDDYRIQQFKKSNPDKDASVAYKLFASDVTKLTDLEVLTQFEMLDGVIRDEAEAQSLLADKYAIDLESDPKEWTVLARAQLKRDANRARAEIKTMKEEIKLPTRVDVEGQRKQAQEAQAQKAELLKKGWNDIVPSMITELKEVEINDYDKDGKPEPVFKYAIADEAKPRLQAQIMEHLLASGKEINADNVKEAGAIVQSWYVLQNIGKMIKAVKSEIAAEIDRKKDEETHNPIPLKTEVKPVDDTEAKRRKEETEYALGGSGFKYNKPI